MSSTEPREPVKESAAPPPAGGPWDERALEEYTRALETAAPWPD